MIWVSRFIFLTLVHKAIFCDPCFKGTRLLGNTVGVTNGVVVPKKKAASSMHEVIDLGKVAAHLGDKYYKTFRAILCMGKTDFNWNVHKITTERMLKTFFWSVKAKKVINAKRLLENPKCYGQFYTMCYSKLCGNSARKPQAHNVTQADIVNYLRRCQWILKYWSGHMQSLGRNFLLHCDPPPKN